MEKKSIWGLAVALASVAASVAATAEAVEIRQVFRPERYQRGDTNVSRVQEIDDAHWIWHPTAPSKGEVGKCAFLRFRKEFEADDTPLRFDVSGDERFILLIDGDEVKGEVTLPEGVSGAFEWKGQRQTLAPGRQFIALSVNSPAISP